jgi:hypothetical protein
MSNYTFKASLRLFGGDIPHEDICRALGVTPKWQYRAGEPRVTPKGQALGGVYPSDYCVIDLAVAQDLSLADFIDQQVQALLIHKEIFQRFKQSSGCAEFFIGWFGDGNFGATFQSDTLRLMGESGIDLSLDVYPLPGSPIPAAPSGT